MGGPVTPPGFYSSPQMDKIWGQPPAPIQPPPGFSGPPGFNRPPDTGDGLREAIQRDQIMQNSQPISVEEIERRHFEQKQGGMDRAPGGARAPGSPVDDPAILMATPQRAQPQPPQPNQLQPQHRRMLEQSQNRNRQNRDRNDNRNRQNQRRPRDPYANLMSKREREWITSMQLRAL